MSAHRPGAPPGKKEGLTSQSEQAESSEAGNLKADTITNVIALPPAGWKIAMRRAHAIRKYRGTAKVYAVRLWRVAVVDALEVRP
jgi:hypothetical protein